jgi:gluconolactonase
MFMKAAGAAATLAAIPGKALADRWTGTEGVRLPDALVQVLDYRLGLAKVERLWTGAMWAEGPVWFGDQRCVIFSDIPNNRMLKYDEQSKQVTVFREPANYGNGNARDNQGRLVTAEHGGGRRITRTEYDGTITVICDKFDGKQFNSPNDVVVKKDDSTLRGIQGQAAPAVGRLPLGCEDEAGRHGGERHQGAERPLLLPR